MCNRPRSLTTEPTANWRNKANCHRMSRDVTFLGFEKTNPIPAQPLAGDAFTVARASRPCQTSVERLQGIERCNTTAVRQYVRARTVALQRSRPNCDESRTL